MNARRTHESGLSLIELLVALAIGAFLIFGATQVYVDSRNAYGVNETVARLQETARYALSAIEPDVRMANYWGLVKGASVIGGQTSQQSATAAPAWGGVTACGDNFATDLNVNVQSDDNQYLTNWTGAGTTTAVPSSCDTVTQIDDTAWSTTPVTTADTLTVRRASTVASPSTNNWLQICSTRIAGQLIWTGPACNAVSQQVNNLIVNAYYVDRNSSQADGLPSLRRKTLIHPVDPAGAQSRFADQEIIPGVEDMQVQFGIDNTGISGIATRYINPVDLETAIQAGGQVVAVRIWLLMRSDEPEIGFTDDRIYEYGDRTGDPVGDLDDAGAAGRAYQPSLSSDTGLTGRQHFRRLLVSRTIQIRNALGT